MSGICLSMSKKLQICQICGITSQSGSPAFGIPHPVIKPREELKDQILCDDCVEEIEIPSDKDNID